MNDQLTAQQRANIVRDVRQALQLYQQGQVDAALRIYKNILAVKPDHSAALHMSGVIALQRGRPAEALDLIASALAIRPSDPAILANMGAALQALGRPQDALANFDKALALRPDFPDVLNLRGNAFLALRQPAEALANYDRAIVLNSGHADAWANRANILIHFGRLEEALAACDRSLALRPDFPEALNNRGNALKGLSRPEEALESYHRAVTLRADYVDALSNRGSALKDLNRLEEAIQSFDRALQLAPNHADVWFNRGSVLLRLGRYEEALASYDRAIALRPGAADAHFNRGVALSFLKRMDEAAASYRQALALKPQHPFALSGQCDAALDACDWAKVRSLTPLLIAQASEKRIVVPPFMLLAQDADANLQRTCAETYIRHYIPRPPPALWRGERYAHERIRLAYLSADFRNHPVASLTAELFETHDRSRFEITAISYGTNDGSEIRARLEKSFERFEDVRSKSDSEAARLIRDLEIDIAVDLGGYTRHARPGILAQRPAPVQASYLGYPGTMGADFIDYIIADETALPFDQQPFYAEKIVHLPDCYMVSDRTRKIAEAPPSRSAEKLPEAGFVFCSFNSSFKINAPVFDVWMRLLNENAGSVLWLRRDHDIASDNLRREAFARGIDPKRIVFAERAPLDVHYARHRLADLFLDTLPYNAHTTASDALWAGLPVLTCMGDRFQGRVAASLLKAIGLPELVTTNLQDYEALARKLMNDPALLKTYRDRLAANRLTTPLFDTPRFARNLEAAFIRMHERRGQEKLPFAVAP